MEKEKKEKLIYKLAVIFLNFSLIAIIISGIATYVNQMDTYTRLCRDNSRKLGAYLANLMESEGFDTREYIQLYMEHYREFKIPYDFDEYLTAYEEYHDLFSKKYPGMTLGANITVEELSDDVQLAFFKYTQEYWVLTFERARDAFDQAYTYFLIMGDPRARIEDLAPGEDPAYNVLYLIDGERTEETVINENGEKVGTGYLYLGDTYGNNREDHRVEWETWERGETLDKYYEWNNNWGHTYTFYTPLIINGEKIGLVCTDVKVETINRNILRDTMIQIGITSVVLIVCVICMVWFIKKTYIDRIVYLEASVREFAADKNKETADRIDKTMNTNDELGSLAHQTADTLRELGRYIGEITAMSEEKQRFGAELSVATKIQLDMLPKDFPKRNDLDMYALMSPAKEVGGDFYDFFFLDSDHIALVMADVSGKGVPAALFMVIAKTLISNQALSGRGTPASILDDVNFRLCESNASGMFITAWLGILTLSTGEVICANAGHEYPAVKRSGGKYELMMTEHCPPLAADEETEYVDETFRLGPGDSLFLYTDGIPEAKNSLGKHLGTTQMLEIMNAAPDLAPHDLLTGMKDLIDDFARGTDTFDYITMMCVHYLGK